MSIKDIIKLKKDFYDVTMLADLFCVNKSYVYKEYHKGILEGEIQKIRIPGQKYMSAKHWNIVFSKKQVEKYLELKAVEPLIVRKKIDDRCQNLHP